MTASFVPEDSDPASTFMRILDAISPLVAKDSRAAAQLMADVMGHDDDVRGGQEWMMFATLPVAVRDRIDEIAYLDQSIYRADLDELRGMLFGVAPGGSPRGVVDKITEVHRKVLATCADALQQSGLVAPDGEVARSLRTLIDEVVDLYNSFAESEIDPALRDYVLARLSDLEAALRNYWFMGAGGLEEVIERTVGGVVLRRDHVSPGHPGTEETRGLLKRLFALLGRAGEVAKTGNAVLELVEKTSDIV